MGCEPVDFLVRLLFESTLMLGGCLAVMLFVLLVHWRRSSKPRLLLIGLALSVVLLLVQALVVTRREHADRIMKWIETDMVASRTDAIAAALSDRFRIADPEMDGDRFLELVRGYMAWVDVRSLTRRKLEIETSEADTFQAHLSYWGEISARNYVGPVQSRWRIVFVRDTDGWRILSIEPTMLQRMPVSGWSDLSRR